MITDNKEEMYIGVEKEKRFTKGVENSQSTTDNSNDGYNPLKESE